MHIVEKAQQEVLCSLHAIVVNFDTIRERKSFPTHQWIVNSSSSMRAFRDLDAFKRIHHGLPRFSASQQSQHASS